MANAFYTKGRAWMENVNWDWEAAFIEWQEEIYILGQLETASAVLDDMKAEVKTKPKWETGQDPLFGAYRWRKVGIHGGVVACFQCGELIGGIVLEKERGGTSWYEHVDGCPPGLIRRTKKRKP